MNNNTTFGDEGTWRMAALHGTLSRFDTSKESWSNYIEQMKHYFAANKIADEGVQRSILLSTCGSETFTLIRNLVDSETLDGTSYADIVAMVRDYYDPKPSSIVQRYKFNSRVRASNETVASYVAALRQIAEHCEYKDSLNEMLRDRLVCGVNHQGIQRRLLAEKDLTYAKALDLAKAMEAAEKSSQALTSEKSAPTSIYYNHRPQRYSSDKRAAGNNSDQTAVCYRCGGRHLANNCRFRDQECHKCKKRGHIAKVCRSSGPTQVDYSKQAMKPTSTNPKYRTHSKTHYVTNTNQDYRDTETLTDSREDSSYTMFPARSDATDPIIVTIQLNGIPVDMELDTGASLTIISEATFANISHVETATPLEPTEVKLTTYTGESIPIIGKSKVLAKEEGEDVVLPVIVVKGTGPNLLGRDWLEKLQSKPWAVHSLVVQPHPLKEILENHSSVFSGGELGCLKGFTVQLQVDESNPKFHRPRQVPLVMKKKVEEELERLHKAGIISPVQFAKWAAPIVPVLKKDGSLRICGDFKVTINQASQVDPYPLTPVEELFASLSRGKQFTKLDLAQAYLQLPLAKESKEFVTINTTRGLFQYNRLPFGVSSAPAIFQRCMETLLRGCPGVSIYLDDILVTGETKEEHLKNLCLVLTKLETAGLKLNKAKCKFLQERIEYLGHAIDAEGLHPTEEKVKAIKEAPKPKNVTELRSFLGIINYYSRFLPQLSTKLAPLYSLLHKNSKWAWKEEQEKAFHMAKVALQSNSLLVHYDPNKEIILSCDASPYGIGAVLSHVMEDGSDRPIAYTSRTLTTTECKYSQLEKEGLAIVFGTKRFHNYLYGRFFHIESDHQPLSYLFKENKEIPCMASSRIQRWPLTLSAYQYAIRYKPGKLIGNADALSRLPRPVTTTFDCTPEDLVQLINHLSTTTVKSEMIKNWTCKDPLLSLVLRYTLSGWPSTVQDSLRPFHSCRNELSTLDGCVLWGSRIIVPPKGRQLMLNELHETHPGCSRMKALARSYIWWPKMDSEIEEVVKTCNICQEQRPSPPVVPVHPWEWPERPWSRLHLDFAGPFMGHMFLVIVDAHSKWLDAHIMPNITTTKTIEILRRVFSTHGIPQKIVTDNGPSFVSAEFEEFLGSNGIKHNTSAPYHPSTNGLAERGVQTLKKGLKVIQGNNLEEKLYKFLFNYRITPHTSTGISPSELLMGRRLRSRLDLLYPNITRRVESSQQRQKESHDNTKPVRRLEIGDMVYAEDFRVSRKSKWLPGMVSKVTGPISYVIELSGGGLVRRHIDNIRSRQAQGSTSVDELDLGVDVSTAVESDVSSSQPPSTPSRESVSVHHPTHNDNSIRRSSRPSRPPDRYTPRSN